MRYANGEVQIAVTDLSAGGYGKLWQHRRIYSNRLTADGDLGNGTNWLVESWPYLVEHADQSLTVVRGTRKSLWFDLVAESYVGRYGVLSTLTHDAENELFVLTLPGGGQYRFHDFAQDEYPQGLLASHVTPGGQVTEVTSYTGEQRIEEIQRSTGAGGDVQTQSFRYAYNAEDRIASVTLRRRTGQGEWTELRRVQYAYYGEQEAFGNEGDSQLVTSQVRQDGQWVDTQVRYYRYYQPEEPQGFAHGLKYVVGPEAYARMESDGHDPLTAASGLFPKGHPVNA